MTPPPAPGRGSVAYLLERLAIVEARVRVEIGHRRAAATAEVDDRLRGLYLSDDRIDELLDAGPAQPLGPDPATTAWTTELERRADEQVAAGAVLRLRELAAAFDLLDLDVELLLIAAAPDIDPRFEALYGYLNDDVSRRRATTGLALLLCGIASASAAGRARLSPEAPLVRHGLVTVDRGVGGGEVPLLSRPLTVPDRVVAHLLGDDAVDAWLASYVVTPIPLPGPGSVRLQRALEAGETCAYVQERRGASAASAAIAALDAAGLTPLALDLDRVPEDAYLTALATTAIREARLTGAALVAGPIDEVVERDRHAIAALATAGCPVILHGTRAWDPRWASAVPVLVEADRAEASVQAALWREELDDALDGGEEALEVTAHLRMTPAQIRRAARSARGHAASLGRGVTAADLVHGARTQNAAGLNRLARRIEPAAGWEHLILPTDLEQQLRDLASRWRHRDQVLETWGLGRGAARGRGVSALFAGPSGTGKTLSAEVLAADLGLDLYVIDLSTVVDKYIGETSKNLERIFDEADRVNGVLLFDEADALFGKRSAVSDSKDRHANLEVAFLLQRMESFDGVAILTTNLAANLDDAFLRRLDAIVDFPAPDVAQRRALWVAKLDADLPLGDDVDVEVLAEQFRLSGSEIQNSVISAAYRAADQGAAVTMADLVRAVIREHRKVGRHLSASDLEAFAGLLELER